MAFAPPRKPRTQQKRLDGTAATRIPLASPARKPSKLADDSSEKPIKGPRVIPSRYLQIPQKGPLASGLNADPSVRKSIQVANGARMHGTTQAGLTVAPSPTKIRPKTAQSVIETQSDDTELREALSLRILQTLQTCEEGERAVLHFEASARRKLAAQWEELKNEVMERQLHQLSTRIQDDAQELDSFSTEEVLSFETFLLRFERVHTDLRNLVEELDDWAAKMTDPISEAWQTKTQRVWDACQATKLPITPLIERLNDSQTNGVVYTAVTRLYCCLEATLEAVVVQRDLARRLWEQHCREIDRRFEALVKAQPESSLVVARPYLWGIP